MSNKLNTYLSFNGVIYDPVIEQYNQEGLLIPLSNMRIATEGDLEKTEYIIPDMAYLDKRIADTLSGLGSIQGTVYVSDKASVITVIDNFNLGQSIFFTDGTEYNKGLAVSGDIVIIEQDPVNATETVQTEQAIVDNTLNMSLVTNNNSDDQRLTKVEEDNERQDTEIADLQADVAGKIGGIFGTMSNTYDAVSVYDVAIKRDIDNIEFIINSNLIGNSGDGTYDTLTFGKVRNDGQDVRITAIEDAITGGVDFDIIDSILTTNYETLPDGGLAPIAGDASICVFNLPSQDDDGLVYNYGDYDRMTIWLYDGVATTSRKMVINSSEPTNFHFRDNNFNITATVDTTTTPNTLTCTKTDGNDNIFNVLKIGFIEQTKTVASVNFAKTQDLVDLENRIQTDLNLKQDKNDLLLGNTTGNTSVVNSIINNYGTAQEALTKANTNITNIETISKYASDFNVNVGLEATTGVSEDAMYQKILAEYTLGRIGTGSGLKVRAFDTGTLKVEISNASEIITVDEANGTILIGVDRLVDGNEVFFKGTLLLRAGVTDDAEYTLTDQYVFLSDITAGNKDITHMVTWTEVYTAFVNGTIKEGDVVKISAGQTDASLNQFIYATVGKSFLPAGSPPGANHFTLTGSYSSVDGTSKQDLYKEVEFYEQGNLEFDDWSEIMTSSGRTFVFQEIASSNSDSSMTYNPGDKFIFYHIAGGFYSPMYSFINNGIDMDIAFNPGSSQTANAIRVTLKTSGKIYPWFHDVQIWKEV